MFRVNRPQTRLFRITTAELFQRNSLSLTDVYVLQGQLGCAGHVMRIPWDRLPRKMISSWVRSKSPEGCSNLTYGRSLEKSWEKADFDVENFDMLIESNLTLFYAKNYAVLYKTLLFCLV